MTAPRVDQGDGNPRTQLAWQRTALSVVVFSAVLARLTVSKLGTAALPAVGLAASLGLWVLAESRLRRAPEASARAFASRLGGGRAHGALALSVVVIGLTELVALATVWSP